MSGIHRLPHDPAARIRSFVSGAAAVGAIPADGLGIYLLVIGTPLQDWIALLAGLTALLAFQILRRHRDASLIWFCAGWELSAMWQVVSAFAHGRAWPAGELAAVAAAGNWVSAALAACVVGSIVVRIRAGTAP